MSNASTANGKPFWLSKTFWLNLLAIASMAFPAVRDWLAENPVEFVAAFAAAGILLRFATSGKVSFSGGGVVPGGGSGGILPLGMLLAVGLGFLALPSCSTEYPLTGSILYRDPGTGAKGGLVFVPGEKPTGFLRMPILDPDTGEQIGMAEISAPVGNAVDATK
jgi:hypothetical protein